MRFRPKPIWVEATQWDLGKRIVGLRPSSFSSRCMELPGKNGPLLVRQGDWIVKTEPGDFFVVSDEVFQKIYEPQDES